MTRVRTVTVAGDPELEAALAERIDLHADFDLVMRCVDRAELLGAVRGGSLDVVVAAGLPHWVDPQVAEEARARALRIVVVGADVGARDGVARLGLLHVRDADPAVILAALESPPRTPSPSPTGAQPPGKFIAVWGPKGSPGRTSIALELASHIARAAPATVLIDADPYGGDLLQLAGVVEEVPTIVWAARMAAKDELDAAALGRELRRVGSRGPVLLPGLPRPELWPEISDFGWRRLVATLRAEFEYALCDTGFCFEPDTSPYPESGEGRNRIARAALADADRIVAVCKADPVGVKHFAWAVDALRTFVDLDKVIVVLNRGRSGAIGELRELVKRHTGKRSAACVPDRPGEWQRAVEAGAPLYELNPRSDVADALKPVVELLGIKVPGKGVLTRLAGRR